MPSRRQILFAVAALPATAAFAAEPIAFASANFAAAQEAGVPIVVHIDATWCPTCKAQKPILAGLLREPRFKAVKAFFVDYDSEKPVMRQLYAPDRSTILVFANGKEVARSTGETTEAKIAALIEKAL